MGGAIVHHATIPESARQLFYQTWPGWTCGTYRAFDLPAEEASNPPEPNCHRRSPAKAAGTVNVKDLTLQQRELAGLLNHRGMAEGSQAQFCLSRFFLSLCGLLSALLGPALKLSASHVPTRRPSSTNTTRQIPSLLAFKMIDDLINDF